MKLKHSSLDHIGVGRVGAILPRQVWQTCLQAQALTHISSRACTARYGTVAVGGPLYVDCKDVGPAKGSCRSRTDAGRRDASAPWLLRYGAQGRRRPLPPQRLQQGRSLGLSCRQQKNLPWAPQRATGPPSLPRVPACLPSVHVGATQCPPRASGSAHTQTGACSNLQGRACGRCVRQVQLCNPPTGGPRGAQARAIRSWGNKSQGPQLFLSVKGNLSHLSARCREGRGRPGGRRRCSHTHFIDCTRAKDALCPHASLGASALLSSGLAMVLPRCCQGTVTLSGRGLLPIKKSHSNLAGPIFGSVAVQLQTRPGQ